MPWQQILKYAFLAVFVFGLWYWHHDDKTKALEALKMEMKAEAEAQLRAKEQILTYEAFKLGREKDEKINTINRKLTDTLRLLSQRPSRPSNPSATPNREACTGAQLYREDGEFLAREAARADEVAAERDYYYERYENARRTLAGEKQDEGRPGETVHPEPIP